MMRSNSKSLSLSTLFALFKVNALPLALAGSAMDGYIASGAVFRPDTSGIGIAFENRSQLTILVED